MVVRLRSEDVIHSFFLPYLRVKQDAVPGMTTRTWFRAAETGEYQLACAELCGLGHYRMHARTRILPPGEFEQWHSERSAEAEAAGEESFWTESPPGTPARIEGMPGHESEGEGGDGVGNGQASEGG